MKEALMFMASAWSVASILFFVAFVSLCAPISPDRAQTYGDMPLILLGAAVTGAGWLWFRHEAKKKKNPAVNFRRANDEN